MSCCASRSACWLPCHVNISDFAIYAGCMVFGIVLAVLIIILLVRRR